MTDETGWLAIALTFTLLGVLIHINLDTTVGVIILFLGLTLILMEIILVVLYCIRTKERSIVLTLRYLTLTVFVATTTYAGYLMLTTPDTSTTTGNF